MRNLILFTVLLFSGFVSAQTFDFGCEDVELTSDVAGVYSSQAVSGYYMDGETVVRIDYIDNTDYNNPIFYIIYITKEDDKFKYLFGNVGFIYLDELKFITLEEAMEMDGWTNLN